jgi:hypothetical protein
VNLDVAGRFQLQAKSPGYRLLVDGKQVSYCRSPGEALAYMAEKLISEAADKDVVASLAVIENQLSYARRALDLSQAVHIVARALARAEKGGGDRRSRVAAAALEISGAPTVDVFRKSNQAKEVAELAKVIIDTWSRINDEGGREEAVVRAPTQELDQDL